MQAFKYGEEGGMGMGSEARPQGLTRIASSGVPFLWLGTISSSIE